MNRKKNENETGTHSRERNINTELRDPRIPSPPPPRGAGKKRKQSVAGKIAPPPPPHKKSKNEAFEMALDNVLSLLEGGHEYRNLTSNTFEKKLEKANRLAGSNSGRLSYDQLNKNRKDLIKQAETKRPLKRSEYINRYGYDAWLSYCFEHNIPENSKYTLPSTETQFPVDQIDHAKQ